MALEDEVKNLTKAIEALTKQLAGATGVNIQQTEEKQAAKKPPAKSVEEKAPALDIKAVEQEASDESITLEVLAKDFTALVAADIDKAKAILKEYGATKLSLVDPKHFVKVAAAVQGALNG